MAAQANFISSRVAGKDVIPELSTIRGSGLIEIISGVKGLSERGGIHLSFFPRRADSDKLEVMWVRFLTVVYAGVILGGFVPRAHAQNTPPVTGSDAAAACVEGTLAVAITPSFNPNEFEAAYVQFLRSSPLRNYFASRAMLDEIRQGRSTVLMPARLERFERDAVSSREDGRPLEMDNFLVADHQGGVSLFQNGVFRDRFFL